MTRCSARMRGSRAGFTLLELLVALALLGLVATMALGGVRLGARTWETVGARAEAMGRTQMVRAFLARELSQAMPVLIPSSDGSERLAYEGDRQTLTFVAPLASHFGLGGAQRLRLSIVDSEDRGEAGKELVLVRRTFDPDEEFAAELETRDEMHVLLDGIAEAAFSYRAGDEGSGWSDVWLNESALPGLVRLDVTFDDNAVGDWPSLLAVTRITADADCFMPVGGTTCGAR